MATFEFPSDVRAASDLTLWLVLKRMLQDIVQQMIVDSLIFGMLYLYYIKNNI